MNLNDNITVCLDPASNVSIFGSRKSWIVEMDETGFKARGFGDLTSWRGWDEEGSNWIRGWHEPDSLEVQAMQAAKMLS